MKKWIIIFILLVIGAFGLAIYSHQNASRDQADLTQERYLRMVAEENLEKASSQISGLEEEIAKLKNKSKGVDKLLEQTTAANTDLKAKLDKTSRVKDELEGRLKELEEKTASETGNNPPLSDTADKI